MDRRTERNGGGERTKRGRPPLGPALVHGLDHGSALAKQRLDVILRTLAGTMTIEDAANELGVGRSRFHAMRSRFLTEATTLLEPRPTGPAPRGPLPEARERDALRAQVEDLTIEVHAAKVREELALVLPHLVKRSVPSKGGFTTNPRT